jgi:hypothetical protein
LSDHRYILFQIGNVEITRVTFRDPKKTDWRSYEDLIVNLEAAPHYVCSVQDVELAVEWFQQSILSCYYRNCWVRVTHSPRGVPWWNKELRDLKAQTRRLFNTAKMTGEWGPYKESLICHNKESQKVFMEKVLPGDRRSTRQCQTHEDYSETGEQQSELGEDT